MPNTNSPTSFLSGSLDFNTYRSDLRTFLQSQDQFKDYDFVGSNLSVLIDLLAYNTYNSGVYLNMIGSEMFLDTALLRESIVSHAKELNYTPGSRVSSQVSVDLQVSGNNLPGVITIPKGQKFSGISQSGSYQFVTDETINIGSANNYTAIGLNLYEGRIITEKYVANSSTRYVIQSANVDISSIDIGITSSITDTNSTDWYRSDSFFGLDNTSQVFFVQGYKDNFYEVVFGNDIIGKALDDGNVITISYRDTLGSFANGLKRFAVVGTIGGSSDVNVTINTSLNASSSGGGEAMTNDQIKFNAPRAFATQNRAIIPSDFVTLLKDRFPEIQNITAYGGEDAEPRRFGTIILSAKPKNALILNDRQKDQVVSFLSTKMTLGLKSVMVDADYFYATITTRVQYNINTSPLTADDIQTAVLNTIVDYGDTQLSDFGNDLRFSKLTAAIDSTDRNIISNSTKVLLTKKLSPFPYMNSTYAFSFANPIKGYLEFPRFAYPDGFAPFITSSTFMFKSGETIYNASIQDDGLGQLYIFTIDRTGVKKVLKTDIGSVDYGTGNVLISNLNISGYIEGSTSISINAWIDSADIEMAQNKILLIDAADIVVEAIGIRI